MTGPAPDPPDPDPDAPRASRADVPAPRGAAARRRLRVAVTDGRGRPVRADRLRRWLAGVAPPAACGDVALALVGDRLMRTLNHRHRGIDRATDVLAFPTDPTTDPRPAPPASAQEAAFGRAAAPDPAAPDPAGPDPAVPYSAVPHRPGPDAAAAAASQAPRSAAARLGAAPSAAPASGPAGRHLGDIVIATGVARRQARAAGHALGVELRCLALHGLLHLLGYDHARDTGEMHRLERRLRRQGGIG